MIFFTEDPAIFDEGEFYTIQSMAGLPSLPPGRTLVSQSFAPTAEMAVTAWVNGNSCGQGQTMEVGSEVVYSIHVFADGPGGAAGCGEPGSKVTFWMGGQTMSPAATWTGSSITASAACIRTAAPANSRDSARTSAAGSPTACYSDRTYRRSGFVPHHPFPETHGTLTPTRSTGRLAEFTSTLTLPFPETHGTLTPHQSHLAGEAATPLPSLSW